MNAPALVEQAPHRERDAPSIGAKHGQIFERLEGLEHALGRAKRAGGGGARPLQGAEDCGT